MREKGYRRVGSFECWYGRLGLTSLVVPGVLVSVGTLTVLCVASSIHSLYLEY